METINATAVHEIETATKEADALNTRLAGIARDVEALLRREIGGACWVEPGAVSRHLRAHDVSFVAGFDSLHRRSKAIELFALAGMPLLGVFDQPASEDDPEFPDGTFEACFGAVEK